MLQIDECPITGDPVEVQDRTGDFATIHCPRCGLFRVTGSALKVLEGKSREQRKTYLREAQRKAKTGEVPYIRDI